MDKLAWADFSDNLRFKQGEHVILIGPTGQGKTTLARELIKRRNYVTVIATKPRDPMVASLVKQEGYWLAESWPPPAPRDRFPRVVFWPPIERMRDMSEQRERIRVALMDVYEQGGWCVYLDEGRYVADQLKLGPFVTVLWIQGRTLGISLICSTQRPFWIPQEAYDQSTHMFLWRENDERNLRRYGEFSQDADDLKTTLATLPACTSCDPDDICKCGKRGYFVYLNTRSGEQVVSRVELEEGVAA